MPKGKGVRHCGKCGKSGHYSSTCKARTDGQPREEVLSYEPPEAKALAARKFVRINDPRGNGPLVLNGEIVVNKAKYPNLYAALERGKALVDEQKNQWNKVLELRKQGQDAAADRLINKLLGISKPMSEEAKAKLKEYYEKNKEEIQERQKQKRELRKRTMELVKSSSEKLTRKRGG